MNVYSLSLVAATAAGWAVFVASLAVLHAMDPADGRWLTAAGWLSTGLVGFLLGVFPRHFVTAETWPMSIFPVSLAMVTWGHLKAIIEQSTLRSRFRGRLPAALGVAVLVAGCMFIRPAVAQTVTAKGTYTAIPADVVWNYRAGAGTGALLAGPFETLVLCVEKAEADAAKADTAKDSTATCRPDGGNVAVTFKAAPPPPAVKVWVRLGPEKNAAGAIQTYTLAAPALVRFGAGTTWAQKQFPAGPVRCATAEFGDPVPGVVKACEREATVDTAPPATTPPVTQPPVIQPPVTTPPATTPPVSSGGVPMTPASFNDYPLIGQVTAAPGQVIERVRIKVASGPCVIVAVPNVTIRDVQGIGCGAGEPGKFVDVRSGASNLTVERNHIEDVSTALYANGAAHPIVFDRNYVTKIRGPMPRGQMVQLNNVKGGTGKSRVTCNVGDVQGQPNAWRNVEDWLNFYSTGGVEVAYNRLRGGGYQGYNGNNPSGTAVLFGDAAGGTDAWVHDNRFVGMTNVGVGVAGGVGARIERNQIHMDARLSGNFTNVGIYVAKYSSGACSGHTVTGNRVFVRKADGSLNPRFFAAPSDTSYCGAVNVGSPDSNVWNDTTLDPEAMFNTVPAECQ